MTEQAPPEAIEAMIALVREMAEEPNLGVYHASIQRIAALLPKPVDPAVLACREILAASWEDGRQNRSDVAGRYRRGENDSTEAMSNCLAAYRAGAASTKGRG